MNRTLDQIAEEAMTLSTEERVELADRLWASLDEAQRAEYDRAWAEEVERRVDEVNAGTVHTIPASEVFAEMEQRLKARK
jgi:putative addiction module component (TIGR02574 family)